MKFESVLKKCQEYIQNTPKGIIVVVGPTASGKTSLSIAIAKALQNAEIINADSRQIYKDLPILTAVPTQKEQENIPHHLFETIEPEKAINVSEWKTMAEEKIKEIQTRKNIPIICGGTGLWINSLTKNFSLGVEPNEEFRKEMQKKSNDELWKILQEKDPEACKNLHQNNKKYVIRALEICEAKGKKSIVSQEGMREYSFYIIGITHKREKLYERIQQRNELMLSEGVIDEVKQFINNHTNIPTMDSAFIAHGVPEISAYLNGKMTFDVAKEKMLKNTKNYAKRQLTWWRRDNRVHWISGETGEPIDIKNAEW